MYLARDLKHKSLVAIKVLAEEFSLVVRTERFVAEIETAARLTHPHIVKPLDSGSAAGLLYYVMPYIDGGTLSSRIEREGRLPIEDAVAIAREVADALGYAHAQEVIHRDIKPGNILLSAGHAWVTDFGIAKAMGADSRGMTGTGARLGTADYMSPEQVTGAPLDGRTDIYSLGCVLFEMLAGAPPFEGPNLESVLARRVVDPAPLLRSKRRDAPEWLEQVVAVALATKPADRFGTAEEFAEALKLKGVGSRVPKPRRPSRRLVAAATALVAMGAIGAAAAWRIVTGATINVDPERYVILPFAHTRGAQPTIISGELCARLLYQGFAQWADVSVTDPLRVNDALQRLDESGRRAVTGLDGGLAVARGLGAGLLVRGELWQFRDTTFVTAAIYDVRQRGRLITTREVRIVPGNLEAGALYGLADSLLMTGTHAPPGPARVRPTASTRALLAHEEGHRALDQWDVAGSMYGFRRAAQLDSAFAHAFLELAQVKAWQDLPVETWRDTVARAVRLAERLDPRERLLARALEAMGDERQDEACRLYRALVSRDSLDATAWYGIGECQAKDRVVVRDARSPSGFQFRGSYHAATLAYRRALDLAPSLNLLFRGQVYAHLAGLLYTEPHYLRSGRPLAPDTGLFVAYADLAGDTLAFVPRRAQEVFGGLAGPSHGTEAILRTRALLGDIVTAWVEAFPTSAEAHAAESEWLERQGRLESGGPSDRSALSEIREARRLSGDSGLGPRVALAVSEVRILLKVQRFGAARRLADSMLTEGTDPDAAAAEPLAALAVLTGRAARAATLSRRFGSTFDPPTLDGQPLGAPRVVIETALQFLSYAALGAPADSVRAFAQRTDSLIRAWVRPMRQQMAREVLLLPAVTLAFPINGVSPLHRPGTRNYLIDLQWRLARHDSAAVRAALANLRAQRATRPTGELGVDGIYTEALLLLALGDTTAARDHIDGWLAGLGLARRSLVWQPSQAGTFVRAMALRAELAAQVGDRRTAKRWAENVVALWSDADVSLQPLLERMRRM